MSCECSRGFELTPWTNSQALIHLDSKMAPQYRLKMGQEIQQVSPWKNLHQIPILWVCGLLSKCYCWVSFPVVTNRRPGNEAHWVSFSITHPTVKKYHGSVPLLAADSYKGTDPWLFSSTSFTLRGLGSGLGLGPYVVTYILDRQMEIHNLSPESAPRDSLVLRWLVTVW